MMKSIHLKAYTQMFKKMFHNRQNWKQLKWTSIDKWINNSMVTQGNTIKQ